MIDTPQVQAYLPFRGKRALKNFILYLVQGCPRPSLAANSELMIQDYPTPMNRTAAVLGGLPAVSLEAGVAETVAWLTNWQSPDPRRWLAEWPHVDAMQGETDG